MELYITTEVRVIPAQAGIQSAFHEQHFVWMPACAGMTASKDALYNIPCVTAMFQARFEAGVTWR